MSKKRRSYEIHGNTSSTSTPSRPRRSKLPRQDDLQQRPSSILQEIPQAVEDRLPSPIPKPEGFNEIKEEDFDDDFFDDEDFDTSLFETTINKISTQLTSSFVDPWITPPSSQDPEEVDKREFPLLPVQMNQFMKIKGLKNLYKWQEDCLRMKKVIKSANLIFSLPTSAGKSLVAEVHLLRHLLEGKNGILVLPFVSIVQEKVASLSAIASETGQKFVVEEYAAGNGRIPPIKRRQTPALFIATIEKASQIINCAINGEGPWISCCVVDELHMIGEGIRGARLEATLAKIMFATKQGKGSCQIIGMSATLPNLQDLVEFTRAELFTSDFRPIPLTQYLKLSHFVYRVEDDGKQLMTKFDRQIKPQDQKIDPDGLLPLVLEVIPKHSVLIFCSSRRNCQSVMKLLASQLKMEMVPDDLANKREMLINDLVQELESVGGVDPDFLNSLRFGIAFHHAGLSGPERATIEDGFRDGTLCVLCCTSTLAAGVNLPARRVIIRALTQGRSLLPISTYRQMAGRAGRAGYDTMGEAFIIAPPKDRKRCLELVGGVMNPAESKLDILVYEVILSVLELKLALTKSELLDFFTKYTLVTLTHLQELSVIVARD
ncbi:unnamed protein product, partial [Oikopleura dioica]